MDQLVQPRAAPPLARVPAYGVFVLWVAVCAFAPEVIWQGVLLLRSHFGLAELYTAVFIGVLFTVFVEPLAERLKAGRWRVARHGPQGSGRLVLGAVVSLSVGAALVCVHEALGAFFGAGDGHAGDGAARWAGLVRAIWQAAEWASVPAAVTAAWLVAHTRPGWAWGAAAAACVWTVAIGFCFGWTWQDLAMTAVNGTLIAGLGTRLVRRGWDGRTVPRLAATVALVSLACVLSTVAVQAGVGWARGLDGAVYTHTQAYEDLRFYLGWVLGLAIAPDPVPHGKTARG